MGGFQDSSETTAGGSPSQDRVTEQATFGASGKKKVSGWTVLIFNPVSEQTWEHLH